MILSNNPRVQSHESKFPKLDPLPPLKSLQESTSSISLKIPQLEDSGAVIFQDHDIIKIDSDFVNADGQLLATIQGLAMKAGICPHDEELTESETENSQNQILLIPNESDIIIYGQDPNSSEGLQHEKIIKSAGDLTLISENGTLWSKHGHIYAPDKKVIIQAKNLTLEDFDIIAREIEIQGELAQFTNVRFFTSHSQSLNLNKADFHKVVLHSTDGPLLLTHENLGLYSNSTLVSLNNSIDCFSEGILQFLDTESIAKKEIRQEAADIVNWESSWAAGENLIQYAAGKINSYNTLLAAENSISLDGESISTDALTVIANDNFTANSLKQGRYVNGRLHASGMTALSSQNQYLDLTNAEIASNVVKAEAVQQLMMPLAKVEFGEKAEFISKQQQIEAQGSQIRTNAPENEQNELSFQAKQGTIYLNNNYTQPVKKVWINGKYVELGNSTINSIKDAVIDATRLEGKNSTLTSQTGNIKLNGEKSIELDNVLKRALKGQITEESKQWISEKNNENESVQIVRTADEMDLVNTLDTGTKVQLVSAKRFNASGYSATTKEAFSLQAKGIVKIENSSVDSQKLAMQADELWLSKNNFSFNQLLAKSRTLHMHSSLAKGNSSSFETREGAATFYNNQFKSRLNQIKVEGNLTFDHNAAEGNQKISSKEDLYASHNSFSQGSVDLKSTNGDTLLQNSFFKDMKSVQVENPHGTASIDRIDVKSDDLKIQAQQVDIQNSRLVSNKNIGVKGSQEVISNNVYMHGKDVKIEAGQASINHTDIVGNTDATLKSVHADFNDSTLQSPDGNASIAVQTGRFDGSIVQGKNDVGVHADQSLSGINSNFGSENKTLTIEAEKQVLDHVTMQGVDVVQKGSDLTYLETETKANQSLIREARTLIAQGGKEEAKHISEKINTGIISERSSLAEEKNEMDLGIALLYKNTIEGSEVTLKGKDLHGAKNHFNAHTLKVDADKVRLIQTEAEALLIEVETKEEAALPLSNLKGTVIIENGNAPIDVGHAVIDGTFIAKSEGEVQGPNLQVKNEDKKEKNFGVEAQNIWMPGVKAEAEKIVAIAKEQVDLSKGDLKGKEIGATGKNVYAQQLKAEADKDVVVQAQNTMDMNGAKVKAGAAVDVRGEDVNLDDSIITGDSITALARSSLSATDSTQKAKKEIKIAAKDLRMMGAQTEAEKTHFQASEYANLQGVQIKSDTFTATANNMHAPHLSAEVKNEATLQATQGMNLQNSDFSVGTELDARANYLSMDRSQVDAKSITLVGKDGLSVEESHHKAAEELIQDSDHAIHARGSHLEADTIHQQAKDYIDHRNAENAAKKNVIITSFFDNQKGTLKGDTQAKTTVFDNSHGHLLLGDENSFIETEHLFNDHQTTINGHGSLSIQTPYRHIEQSRINIGGTYQLIVGGAVLDSSIQAKDLFVNASQNRVEVTQQGNVAAGSATFIGSLFHNAGTVRAKLLEIDQNYFIDIGNAIGSEHLIHKVDGSININGMKTPGSLTLVSRQGEIDVSALDIGNDLTLQAQQRIHIDGKVQAAGRGVLLTPGMCHFDHAKVSFRNGLDADVGTFYSQVSDIDVVGRSKVNSIQCQNFRLEGESEVPLYRSYHSQHNTYTPSNFRMAGDLYFNAKNKAENIGSNFLVDGNAYVAAKSFDNKNVEHGYSRIVEAGTYKTRKGFKKKRKTLYKSEHHIVVDSHANTQISGTAELNIGTLNNTGIFLTGNAIGKVGHFDNGNPSNRGQLAPLNPASIPSLKGMPTPRAGGDFQASDTIQLKIGSLNNTGFIEGDKVSLKIKGLFSNRKRLAEEHQDAIRKKKHGKVRTHNVTVDHIQPGGEVKGRILHIKARKTKNLGGIIQGRDEVSGSGGSFDNEALRIRSVNPSNQREKNSFHRAELLSGGKMDLKYTGKFKNVASDVIAWNGLNLTAGTIQQRSQFAVNVAQDKKGWKKRTLQHSIEMEEGKIWSIQGPLNVKSTKGDIDIEGGLGTFEGHLKVDSAQDIRFGARSVSAENKVSGLKASFGNVSWQQTKYNTTKSSLPHVFAGNGAEFNGRNFEAEGLQLDVIGDVEGNFKKSVIKSHKVEHYVKTKGVNIGVQAFGVQAVQAALNHKKPAAVGMALLNEDPALSSVSKLAASRDGVDVVKNGIGSTVKLWNEAAQFAGAYNQGHLGNALGSHFGITDSDGNLFPKVAASTEFTKMKRQWTTSAPSQLNIQGNWKWHAEQQIYQGAEIQVSEDADLQGNTLVGEADSDTFSMNSKGIKPSVSFGPNGLGVGLDYNQSNSKQKNYSNFKLNVGKKLNMQFKNSIRLSGAEVEAEDVAIQTPHLVLESKQDTSTQKHFNVGASTDGRFVFGMGSEASTQVNSVSFIKARNKGVIDVDYMKLIGANTHNIEIKAKHFEKQNIVDVNKGSSFSVDFALPQKSQGKNTPPQGLNYFGEVDFKSHHQEVEVKPVVAGGNGHALGVETNLAKQREVIKDQRMHVGAPIVTINRDALNQEVQELRKALKLDPAPQPQVPVQEEVKPPEKPKIKKEKKPAPEVKLPENPKIKKDNKPAPEVKATQPAIINEVVEAPQKHETPVAVEPVQVKALKKDPMSDMIEFALLANEREAVFEDMIAMRMAIIMAEIPVEIAKKACNLHPQVHKACKKVGSIFHAMSDFVSNHILPNDPESLANHERNIQRDAQFKQERLGIPREMTEQYHRDMQSIVVGNIVALPFMSLGMKIPVGRLKGRIADFLMDESGAVKLPQTKSLCSKDIIKAFEDLGYKEVKGGGKGGHRKLTMEGYPMAVIPSGKEMKKGTAHSLWKTLDKAKQIFHSENAVKAPSTQPNAHNYKTKSHRIDYSKGYTEASKEFGLPPKEFVGTLKKDLVLVNYHSGLPVCDARTCKWATVPAEVNPLRTVEAVKDHLGLLNAFGERTHVSVARIPAGEKVKFLHGRAAKQIDSVTNEFRPGGGVQYRFFDFDTNWIVETRPIPGIAKKKD